MRASHDADLRAAFGRGKLAWHLAQLIVLVVVVVLVIATVPGLGALRSRFEHARVGWILASGLLEAASVFSFALAFHRTLEARTSPRRSAALGMTAQGVNVLVPAGGTGGLAVTGALMARAGVPVPFAISRMVALFVISGVLPNIALLIVAGVGVGIGVLPGHSSAAGSLLPAAIAAVLTGLVWQVSRRTPRGLRERTDGWRGVLGRVSSYVAEGLRSSGRLLRRRDPMLLLGAFGFVLFDLAALAVAFRAIGSPGLPLGTMALAYTLGQVGSVISLPGTTEGGLIGVFLLYGARLVPVTSAVLVYRAVQILVPLALGVIGVAELRRLTPSLGDLEQPVA